MSLTATTTRLISILKQHYPNEPVPRIDHCAGRLLALGAVDADGRILNLDIAGHEAPRLLPRMTPRTESERLANARLVCRQLEHRLPRAPGEPDPRQEIAALDPLSPKATDEAKCRRAAELTRILERAR